MSENETEPTNGTCDHCYLYQANLPRHKYIEHGVALDAEREEKLLADLAEEKRRTNENSKIDMAYIGDGPIQPK